MSYHEVTGFQEENRDIEKLVMLRKAQFSKNCDFNHKLNNEKIA
jgi:hypothetical protein